MSNNFSVNSGFLGSDNRNINSKWQRKHRIKRFIQTDTRYSAAITGNVTIASSASFTLTNGTITAGGNITNNGTFTISLAGNLNIAGNFTQNGTFTSGTSVATFNGSAPNTTQTIGGTAASIAFYSLHSNNTGTGTAQVLLGLPISIGGNLVIQAGTLNCATNQITGPGAVAGTNFNMNAGNATFILGTVSNTTVVSFPVFNAYSVNNAGSTVIYQCDGAQTILNTFNYYNLYIYSGTAAASTTVLSSPNFGFAISGNLIVGQGSAGSLGVTLSLTGTGNITLNAAAGSGLGNITVGADGIISNSNTSTLTSNNGILNNSGTINYTNTGVLSFTGATTPYGTITNSGTINFSAAGTLTATGTVTNTGTIEFTAGALPVATFNIGGDLTNNGTFTCGFSQVIFNATAAQNHLQNINSSTPITFYNLEVITLVLLHQPITFC